MKFRKKVLVMTIPMVMAFIALPVQNASAVPITVIMEVIRAAVTKVIQALDLKVQRLQNQTIWLQNAQKELENRLSKLRLQEISEWNENQRNQYDLLFQELWQVKRIISQFTRVRDIAEMQKQLVREYQDAWGLVSASPVFRMEEKQALETVYLHLLKESLKNLQHLTAVMTSFTARMNDADRLASIHLAEDRIRKNLLDLRTVNARNFKIMHSRDLKPMEIIRENYGMF